MDFHSLARRDLQFLCKKNCVPANLTNVAMAKALGALETVEGIEEIQEALGLQCPKVNSPELPRTGRRTSSREVKHGDEPKIQQQKPSPLPQLHGVTIKTLEITEMASKEADIEETLGFQSLNLTSPELPRTGRRSSRGVTHGDEPKIQHQKPSPLYRSRQAATKDLEVIEMASKKEGRKSKEIPTILSKTPATRKATKVMEAHSSNRRTKKNKEIESHSETPTTFEAKGGKSIGVATRRSTRLSSRKALEEMATAQSKSRSSSRENSVVKMEPLAKEDTEKQEKEEKKEDRVEYGDSCAVIVEEHGKKDHEAISDEFPSFINGENSKNEVGNECEATDEYVSMIQQQQPSLRPRSHWVTTKAREATKMASKEVDDKNKSPKLLPNTRGNTWLSSRKTVEETSGEQGTVKMVVLTEEYAEQQAEQQAEQKEKKDLSEKSDSCVVDPADENEVKDKNEENHGYSSSIEVEKGESSVALVEEVEENGKEVEIIGFSSSAQEEDTNEVENGDSAVVIVEGDAKNDQELEIQAFSSPIEGENSNVERKNGDSDVVLVEEEARNDQGENHGLCFFGGENSKVEVDEAFESKEDSGDRPPVSEYVRDSSGQSPENEFAEVSGDHSPKTNLVEDSSNQESEVSGDLLPANGAVEDSCNHSSDAKLALSSISDSLFCGEMCPLLHEGAIVCTQGYSKIDEEEEGKLSMLFTEMTLKEPEDAPLEPEACQEASFVPAKSPAARMIPQNADIVANADIVIPQDDIPPLYSENVGATEAIRESPEVQESGNVLPSKIAAVTEESIDDDLPDAGELITNCSVDVKGSSFEPRILVCSAAEFSAADPAIGFPEEEKESSGHLPTESLAVINLMDNSDLAASNFVDLQQRGETLEGSFSELCPGFSTRASTIELAGVDQLREIPDELVEDSFNQSFEVPQITDISQCGSFEQHSSASSAELCSELSTVDSSIKFKEAFGDLPCQISAVIDESVEADLPNSGKLTAEDSQQIPVPSTPKFPCESESMSLEELPTVQTQSSEETGMAVTETKDENLELLSLTKLRAMYKQILNGTKTQERKESITKQEDLERLSSIKHDENCKQKLNEDMIKSESKISVIKQEDLECLSRSKLDSNKQKLNDDKIKSERKRTPLKSLNYSTF